MKRASHWDFMEQALPYFQMAIEALENLDRGNRVIERCVSYLSQLSTTSLGSGKWSLLTFLIHESDAHMSCRVAGLEPQWRPTQRQRQCPSERRRLVASHESIPISFPSTRSYWPHGIIGTDGKSWHSSETGPGRDRPQRIHARHRLGLLRQTVQRWYLRSGLSIEIVFRSIFSILAELFVISLGFG